MPLTSTQEGGGGGEMWSGVKRHFFPLTSLQIGDFQSYLAELTIFFCLDTKKFLILLDNRPWLLDQDTRPAHLWQLMVTKSRLSPFANTRTRRKRDEAGKKHVFSKIPISAPHLWNQSSRWYTLIDDAMRSKKLQVNKLKDSRLLNRELHRTLYGFIIFEVDWTDVRGMNYSNELQTDTSMAVEAKIMKRWEFDSINQASSLITSWFSGNYSECQLLQDYLNSISPKGDVFYDAKNNFLTPEWDSENLQSDAHAPPPCPERCRPLPSFSPEPLAPPPAPSRLPLLLFVLLEVAAAAAAPLPFSSSSPEPSPSAPTRQLLPRRRPPADPSTSSSLSEPPLFPLKAKPRRSAAGLCCVPPPQILI